MKKPAKKEKTVVVAFGRFQPPTSGHQVLVDRVVEVAEKMGADHAMFSSRTNDPKKNPLSPSQKFMYLKKFFPEGNFVDNRNIRNPVEMLFWLVERGYSHVVLIGGEDRAGQYKAFERLMNSHKKSERLNLKSFKVVSAGRRNEKASDVTGMSASKMRKAAADKDFAAFSKGMPRKANKTDTKSLFSDLRKGMVSEKPAQKGQKTVREVFEIFSHETRPHGNDKYGTSERSGIYSACSKIIAEWLVNRNPKNWRQ